MILVYIWSIKMILVYILLRFCTVELFINQYTICIIWMTKYWKHLASEELFPRINLYLLRNTSALSIYQNYNRYQNHSSKIHPIHKYIVECWQSLLTLGRDVLIDEALFLWKGRLSWKQFIRTKRAHLGIKTFVLVGACMGYVWNSVS